MGKIFKFILLVILVLCIVSFIFNSYNNNPEVIIKNVFKVGQFNPQMLKYRIYAFGIFPVGEAYFYKAMLEKVNGKDLYHVKGEARCLNIIAAFFKAGATLDSYIDPVDFNPVLFKQQLVISGKSNLDKVVSYDQKQGVMITDGSKRQILSNTQDPLSLMFNLRKMDFDKNKDIEMSINTNQKNYVLKGQIEARDITSMGSKYKAYLGKAEISRRDKNNPYHRSQITIWFVKRQENIPILIKVFASGFHITARLVEIKEGS